MINISTCFSLITLSFSKTNSFYLALFFKNNVVLSVLTFYTKLSFLNQIKNNTFLLCMIVIYQLLDFLVDIKHLSIIKYESTF